ncbi:phosphonate ABC transporter, permease protein PhnE [Pararhodobacter zhoushanensis]|uniref:Phosphonate ABC transporter, permease protein PhnE n=1 Tax=Pararhodobacter zhoushanensis TaxID=2479545 RepID=A0ABT3H020_9RHOB|nr:phosphonate ABC transporter, permease protein PhnE [Pararhodobacter zhoushanensis]MCW1933158.1 phosphonate ABC transporter, permease protein PhnE [Pararhodobacter zhoushanensis]
MTFLATGARGTADLRHAYLAQVQRRRLYSGLLTILFVALMVSGFQIAQARNAGDFLNGITHIFDFPADIVDEAIAKAGNLPGHIWDALPPLIETINIAAVSTLIGTLLGGLLALASTRGLAAWPRLIVVFRRLSDVLRAVPEIVIALVLIFVLGAGPVPAAIAIALHTAGATGKLFSEVNENADLKPVEGLASVGAGWVQRMMLGVLPQVAPNYFSYALLRFEINIRASAILGFVGAGGIGYELKNAMTFGQGKLDEAAGIFIVLFATIVIFDQLSGVIRHRLTYGDA